MRNTLDALDSLKTSFKLDPDKKKVFEKEFPGVKSLRDLTHLLKT